MAVTVSEIGETQFGTVIGFDSVTVTQRAVCEGAVTVSGGGTLPFGAITGGWTGPLQISPPCGPTNGNCGALYIERDDSIGSAQTMINNIARGSDRLLQKHHGDETDPDIGTPAYFNSTGASQAVDCSTVTAGTACNIVSTDTGVSAAHLGEGFFDRLDADPGASCTFSYKGGTLNCDTPTDVLGASWTPLLTQFPSRPAFWVEAVYGTYDAVNTNRHYWYDGVVAKCDSPRRGGVPVVTSDLDWKIGSAHTGWPAGKKDMKVVGMLDVIVEQPYSSADFKGNKNLKTATASVIWYGPNATCVDGTPVGVLNGVPPGTGEITVKLIAG